MKNILEVHSASLSWAKDCACNCKISIFVIFEVPLKTSALRSWQHCCWQKWKTSYSAVHWESLMNENHNRLCLITSVSKYTENNKMRRIVQKALYCWEKLLTFNRTEESLLLLLMLLNTWNWCKKTLRPTLLKCLDNEGFLSLLLPNTDPRLMGRLAQLKMNLRFSNQRSVEENMSILGLSLPGLVSSPRLMLRCLLRNAR